MSLEEGWLCSSGTCVYTRKKELLIVVSLQDAKTFKWIRMYHSQDVLKDGEYLFWCIVTPLYDFILLSEFEQGVGGETRQGAISHPVVTAFDKKKKGNVETFGTQMDKLKKVGRVLTF